MIPTKRVSYDGLTGRIAGWDNSAVNPRPELPSIAVPIDDPIDPKSMIVDVSQRCLRDMTLAERKQLNVPHFGILKTLRQGELNSTDWRQSEPEWAHYRQALRDMTSAGNERAAIAAWPLRPDGSDAIPHLREFI